MSTSIFMQHSINAEMSRSLLPSFDPGVYCTPYIVAAKSGEQPTAERIEGVRAKQIEFFRSVDTPEQFKKDCVGLDSIWPEMRKRFEGNVGLVKLMEEYGCRSRYFLTYLYFTGRGLFFVALVMKDGYGVPISMEEKFEKIPLTDWAYVVAVQEPSHAGRRVTDGSVQTLLRQAPKIFEFGAALLPAYTNYGYPLGANGQQIFACDADPRVLDYLPWVFDKGLEQYGIKYGIGDAREIMLRPEHAKKYDIVRGTGVLSYYPKTEEKAEFIEAALHAMADGSTMVCDLQTMGGDPVKSSLVRSALTKIWPMDPSNPHKLTPSPSVEAAVQEMDGICRSLGLKYVWRADFCNGNPLCISQAVTSPKCVMFLIGKNVSEDMFDAVPELGVG